MASNFGGFDFKDLKAASIYNLVAMFLIFLSGIFMAISYWILGAIKTGLESVKCLIPNNIYFETCQEWFTLYIYPVIDLRYILIFATYFYIFGIMIGLFYVAYKMKKHPSLFVVHMILSIIFGYLSIEIANIYRVILQSEIMYSILTPFAVYNKIMLYFPQVMFFSIFISGLIGYAGIIKGKFKEGADEEIL